MRDTAYIVTLFLFILFVSACGLNNTQHVDKKLSISDTMLLIKGGVFMMGSDEEKSFSNEHPAHEVMVNDFYIDVHEVTNREYAQFVKATGYKTVAERDLNWEELKVQLPPGTPKPSDDLLQPGSLVFRAPKQPVALNDLSKWWVWVIGANWQHPEGPGSNLTGKENHPVVQ